MAKHSKRTCFLLPSLQKNSNSRRRRRRCSYKSNSTSKKKDKSWVRAVNGYIDPNYVMSAVLSLLICAGIVLFIAFMFFFFTIYTYVYDKKSMNLLKKKMLQCLKKYVYVHTCTHV